MMPPCRRYQRLDPAGGLQRKLGAGPILLRLAHRLVHRDQNGGHGSRDVVELGPHADIGGFIGLDREVARGEIGGREMLGVGQRMPLQENPPRIPEYRESFREA